MKFKLSGVQYCKNDLVDILDVNEDFLMKKSEILENYDEDDVIYEYDIFDGSAKLVPEPENEHDSNAIAVVAEGIKIGYVPAELCSEVRDLIDDEYSYDVAIMGGPYKKVVSDDSGNLQIEKGSLNFTATLSISKKQHRQDPVVRPVIQEPEAASKPSTGMRILNYISMGVSIVLVLMGLLLLLVSPIFGVVVIIGGILGFLHFKKRNRA